MNKNTKTLVRESGFKVKFLAEKIGIHPVQLSMALRDERTLPFGKEEELKKFLDKIPK